MLIRFSRAQGLYLLLFTVQKNITVQENISKHIDKQVKSCSGSKMHQQSWSTNHSDWPRMDGFAIQTVLCLSNFKNLRPCLVQVCNCS